MDMKRAIVVISAVVLSASSLLASDSMKIKQLEKRIAALEERLSALEGKTAPVVKQLNAQQMKDDQRVKARERMRKDRDVYSLEELKEIESLYQVANKEGNTPNAKESLEKLVAKYDKANRTGCAIQYLAQRTKGEEREKYLKQAIEGFSDCFYGDGVQVGAYARYYLAYHYKEAGDEKKAKALCEEIQKDYPNAVTHSGKPLSAGIEKLLGDL